MEIRISACFSSVACLAFVLATTASAAMTSLPEVVVTQSQVTIWWTTSTSSSTEVHFGPASVADVSLYPQHSVFASPAGTIHSRTLTGLSTGKYFYRVKSTEAGGGFSVSDEHTFTVPQGALVSSVTMNGPVSALAVSGDRLFVGGSFTAIDNRFPVAIAVDETSGAPRADQPQFTQVAGSLRVLAIAPDGAGGFYIGGDFDYVGGLRRGSVAHLLPDLGVDPFWDANTSDSVYAIAVSDSAVYLGGAFGSVNGHWLSAGVARSELAAVDRVTGAALPWHPRPNGVVSTILVSGSTVYFGGSFTSVDGVSRGRGAAVSAITGELLPWNPGCSGPVSALALSGSTMFIGGSFNGVNSAPLRKNAAAVDATTGVANSWNPDPSGSVTDIAVVGQSVYLVGGFTSVASVTRMHAAAVDAVSGSLLPWNPNLNDDVSALWPVGNLVYLAGIFKSANGGTPRVGIAAVDATTGVLNNWNPKLNGSVSAGAVSNGTVLLGGGFTGAGGASRSRLAALNAATASLLPWSPMADGGVNALLVDGTTLYAGGDFTSIDATTRNRAAALDAVSGSVLPFDPNLSGPVLALAHSGSNLYVAGPFSSVNGSVSRAQVAAVDAVSGAATNWNPQPNGAVNALTVSGSSVFLGGSFTAVDGGITSSSLAAVDSVSGAPLPWDPKVNGAVSSLAVSSSTIYALGTFTSVNGGLSRNFAAAFNATSALPTSWNPLLASGAPDGLTVAGPSVFLASPNSIADAGARDAVEVDATTGALTAWRAFSTFYSPGAKTVAVDCINHRLHVGGLFPEVTDSAGFSIAQRGLASYQHDCRTFVTTAPATGVSGTGARLNASAQPTGTATTGWFRFSSENPGSCDDTFGQRVPASGAVSLGSGNSDAAYSQLISALTAGTTYFFCAIADRGGTLGFGAVLSFNTGGLPPTVQTIAASAVTDIEAGLNSTVNAHGTSTTIHFRYDTTNPGACNDTFGTRAPTANNHTVVGTVTRTYTRGAYALTPATTYYFCPIASNASGTSYGSVLSFTTQSSAPSVTTGTPVIDFSGNGTLSGSAAPNGEAATGWFRFSATSPGSCNDSFGTRVPASGETALGAGTTAVSFTQPISGLTIGSTYFVCAIAANVKGVRFGAVRSFVAQGPAPTVTTAAADGVTTAGATLHGSATPNGAASNGWFRYAPSTPGTCNDTFGVRVPASDGTALGSGSGPVTFSEDLVGLSPGTQYFFCAIASNAGGLGYGTVLSFRTRTNASDGGEAADGGAPPDGGTASDGGTDSDAGAGLSDGGEPVADAGAVDTGDGGTPSPPEDGAADAGTESVAGKPGCGCSSADAMIPLWTCLGLLLRRRGSRRR
jgi:hypothetical protein